MKVQGPSGSHNTALEMVASGLGSATLNDTGSWPCERDLGKGDQKKWHTFLAKRKFLAETP
jgi:hypothetical protein